MTYRQLLEYLRVSSARCRLCADAASDAEAAKALRQVADKMESAISTLEVAEAHEGPPTAAMAL